jgi:hypothetical protein
MEVCMKNTKKLLAASVALALSVAMTPALAAPEDNPDGVYAGLGYGQFRLDIDGFSEYTDVVNDISESDDNAWKAFVGYRFSPYIALEAAYIDFGSPGDRFETSSAGGSYTAELAGFAPYVIGSVPLGPVELFAKLGYYFYDVDLELDLDSDPDADSDYSESDFLYGVGAGLTFFNHLHVRAEYEVIDIDDADANAVWLSGAWRF